MAFFWLLSLIPGCCRDFPGPSLVGFLLSGVRAGFSAALVMETPSPLELLQEPWGSALGPLSTQTLQHSNSDSEPAILSGNMHLLLFFFHAGSKRKPPISSFTPQCAPALPSCRGQGAFSNWDHCCFVAGCTLGASLNPHRVQGFGVQGGRSHPGLALPVDGGIALFNHPTGTQCLSQ